MSSDPSTATNEAQPRPVGRQAVIDAAISAAADLFAENNYNQVSVREIGRRAGVSHALIHRYLGSKEDIFKAVLEWERARGEAFWAGVADVDRLVADYKVDYNADRYLRMVLRAHVEGIPIPVGDEGYVGPKQLLELLALAPAAPTDGPTCDARILVMIAMAASGAYMLAEDFFLSTVGLENADRETTRATIDAVLTRMLDFRS